MLKTLWKNIVNGLNFQIKYTCYSLKRWPIVIIMYFVCICLIGALEPVEVYFQKEIISAVTNNYSDTHFTVLFIAYFLVSVLFLFQAYTSPIVQKIFGLKVGSWIYGKVYRTMQSVPLEEIDSADFLLKCERANEAIGHISSGPAILMYTLAYVIALIIPTVQLLKYPLLLIIYYIVGLLGAVHRTYQTQQADKLRKSIEADKRALRYFRQVLVDKNVMIESRVHGYIEYFHSKWEEMTDVFFQKQIRLKKQQLKSSAYVSFIQQLITIIPICVLYFLLTKQEADIAIYTLVTGMGAVITRYIGYLFNAFSQSSSCGIYIDDIEDILNYEPQKSESISVNENSPIVELQDVSFQYTDNKSVLKDINFHVNEREIVAIVGDNGSGKTTLSNLILGLYKPKKGKIMVYGSDVTVKNINLSGVVSPVFQDFYKYEFSVRENIGYGNIEKINDDQLIYSAMSEGGFDDIYISRSMNLDTCLGKRFETTGEDLSGGEWQRVAISRGVFGNAKLIILDEPTASLDPLSEINLFEKVRSSLDNRAAVIISHRIGICKLADRIVFMRDGRIVEEGTHDELYNLKGNYYDFFNEQSKWYDWSD